MRRSLTIAVLVLVSCTSLAGCSGTIVPTVVDQATALPSSPALSSPLPTSFSSPLPTPVVQETAPVVASTPTLSPPPGVPEEIVHYAGLSRYLIPRLPTQKVLDEWTALDPPEVMQSLHKEFAASLQDFIQAHEAFNESAFKRSETPLGQASERLNVALENHKVLQSSYEQALDQYMQENYGVSLSEIPEIVVPVQP